MRLFMASEKKLRGLDISEEIFSKLLEQITNGTYQPGDKIPSENELRTLYGVSRNTIRAVLNKLNTLGIIETRRGDGSYVRHHGANIPLRMMTPNLVFAKHDLIDILEFRRGIEIEGVKLAAVRASEEDIATLKALMKSMKASTDDMRRFSELDTEMHIMFAKASKNEMFANMMEIVHTILTNDMKNLLVAQGADIDSVFYHESIISCIEHRKPTEAAFLIERHLTLIIERVQNQMSTIQNS